MVSRSTFLVPALAWTHFWTVPADAQEAVVDPLHEIKAMREATGRPFYAWGLNPLRRTLGIAADGSVRLGVGFTVVPIERMRGSGALPRGPDGTDRDRSEATRKGWRDALDRGQRLLGRLAEESDTGSRTVPFELLVPQICWVAALHYRMEDIYEAKAHYLSRPSQLISLVLLEVALLHRALGDTEAYTQTLSKALASFDLESLDFTGDVEYRKLLVGWYNLARPETCVVFLVAEDARRRGETGVASKYYSLLIHGAPASPYAWEAFVRLTMLPDVNPSQINSAKERLLETYPCVWGCSRIDLVAAKVTREQFAEKMPRLINEAAEKVRQRERVAGMAEQQAPEGG